MSRPNMGRFERHRRRSIRLEGYDYTQVGAYFVTICTQNRECLLGRISNGQMRINDAGRMVEQAWARLPLRFPFVTLDESVLMPNHFHGTVALVGAPLVGAQGMDTPAGTPDRAGAPTRAGTRPAPTSSSSEPNPSLGSVIGAFKSITTHQYTVGVKDQGWPPFPGRLWQRNYYERVIRGDRQAGGKEGTMAIQLIY